jgi:membrane-associated phospholipid phosphatase
MSKRNELAPTLARTSPVIFLILTLINCIINPSYNSFYLFISYCLILISNWSIKHLIVKQLYNYLGKKSLPILGIGSRPNKASGCKFLNDGILSYSYGMPSGHSQIAWAFTTYIICKIIKNIYKKDDKNNDKILTIFNYIWLIVSCIIVLLVALYISYSRVYIEGCHTIQQVIIGGILGIISGFIIYYFENDIINLIL